MNNASIAGLKATFAGTPIYAASKFAVVGLTQSVALEFAVRGVRSNAVCPAGIETPMAEKIRQDNELRAKIVAMHPIGRFGQSEEVASAVLYLCSPGAAFTTGVALPINGGILA